MHRMHSRYKVKNTVQREPLPQKLEKKRKKEGKKEMDLRFDKMGRDGICILMNFTIFFASFSLCNY